MSKRHERQAPATAPRPSTQAGLLRHLRKRRKSKQQPTRFAQAIMVAARHRHLIPRGKAILFYGTIKPRTIIREDAIHASDFETSVSFTRSFHVAVHFAMLRRDYEEATGAVLLLDGGKLHCNYRITPYHDLVFDLLPGYNVPSATEAEERIEADHIIDLKRYLLGTIWLREDEIYPALCRWQRDPSAPAVAHPSNCRARFAAEAQSARLFPITSNRRVSSPAKVKR